MAGNVQTDPNPGLFCHRPWPYDQNQEPKKCVYSHLWMLEHYLIVFVSLAMLGPFCCTNNRIIISLLYMYKSITVQNYRGVYRNFNKWPGKYCHVQYKTQGGGGLYAGCDYFFRDYALPFCC